MLKNGWHRIEHQVVTFSDFKKLVSSAKINDEKVVPKLFENWKQEMEAGCIMFFTRWRIWKNVRKCVFAGEQLRCNTLLLLHWKKSNWNVSKISQTLQTWNKIPNDLTLIFYQTPLSTAGHTLHTKDAKNVPLTWNRTTRHITKVFKISPCAVDLWSKNKSVPSFKYFIAQAVQYYS